MNQDRNVEDEIKIGEQELIHEIEDSPQPSNVICWGSPRQEDPKIFISQRAIEAVHKHSISDLENEVGGILVGNVYRCTENYELYVKINCAIRAEFAESAPAHMVFTHESWQEIDRISAELYPGQSYVGWYHTHPGWGVFLSPDDIFIHKNYFTEPWQVALVVDSTKDTFGLFFVPETITCSGFYELLDEGKESVIRWKHNFRMQNVKLMQVIRSAGKYVEKVVKHIERAVPDVMLVGIRQFVEEFAQDNLGKIEQAETRNKQLEAERKELQEQLKREREENQWKLQGKDKIIREKSEIISKAQAHSLELSKQFEDSNPTLSKQIAYNALNLKPDSEKAKAITVFLDKLEKRARIKFDELSPSGVVFESRLFNNASIFVITSGAEGQITVLFLFKKEKLFRKYETGQSSEEIFTCREEDEKLLAIALNDDKELYVLAEIDNQPQIINAETKQPLRLNYYGQTPDLKGASAFMFAGEQIYLLTSSGIHLYTAQNFSEDEPVPIYQYQSQLIPDAQFASLEIQSFTLDSSGNLYIARTTDNRILKITQPSQEIITIGAESGVFDGLEQPVSVHYSDDSLYVLDTYGRGNKRIVQFTVEGEYQKQIVFDPAWKSNSIKNISVENATLYMLLSEELIQMKLSEIETQQGETTGDGESFEEVEIKLVDE